MFNEDVIMTSIREHFVEPGTEVEVIDQQYLEKAFQVKIVNGKVICQRLVQLQWR